MESTTSNIIEAVVELNPAGRLLVSLVASALLASQKSSAPTQQQPNQQEEDE